MQPTITLRAVHKPMIQFLGPRAALWKDATPHTGPHPLTPSNLVKHVAKAEEAVAAPSKSAPAASGNAASSGSQTLEFGQLAARFRRAPISEAEMEAIESGGATFII